MNTYVPFPNSEIETGGLFRILVKLMLAKTPLIPMPNMIALASLMGRYFQLRDDYMNLSSVDVYTLLLPR